MTFDLLGTAMCDSENIDIYLYPYIRMEGVLYSLVWGHNGISPSPSLRPFPEYIQAINVQ